MRNVKEERERLLGPQFNAAVIKKQNAKQAAFEKE